jgi:two-component system, NarL family, response regulator DevR
VDAVRVFLLDDHEVLRDGLRQRLSLDAHIEVVGEAGTVADGTAGIIDVRPDVAIIDVGLPDGNGVEVARHVRSRVPSVRCIMFTAATDEESFLKSVLAGAFGYVRKEAPGEELVDAVRRVAAGEFLIDRSTLDRLRRPEEPAVDIDWFLADLTPHERRILNLIGEGLTNREIAGRLDLAEKTIRNAVSVILSKLGARNRTQLAVYLARLLAGQAT